MNDKCKEFIQSCSDMHTTVSVFIKLYNMWSRLSTKERGQIIDYEIEVGRLEVEK